MSSFDPKKGMSKREFVVARLRVKLPDGAIALFDKSIEHGFVVDEFFVLVLGSHSFQQEADWQRYGQSELAVQCETL